MVRVLRYHRRDHCERKRDLRTVLQSLSDQSLKTSRRLDDTYYSILEKVSTLRQTIGTLQELSSLTKELHGNFETDAQELLDDVQGQFESSNNFDTQQKQLAALEERIRVGKDKADSLTTRLTAAKERVNARAKSEAQWEADTNQAKIRAAPIPEMAKKDILELATSVPTIQLKTSPVQSPLETDDQLFRAFDEL
ncbi:hypothetical protein N0V95_006283 [Ascochyta clinopodiicola]|nr:hypothetical protein N0V95_006283 [Ascochyta clinopodiicola]